MELYLSFQEPHRIRYATREGTVHDEYIEVKYEFTTIEGSMQLQSDLRHRDLIDWFDVDVVWSDTHRRTDSYGSVRGLGTIQRIKLWRDRYSTFHYLTFYANHRRLWKEYLLDDFDRDLRQRDDRHKRVQLGARGNRRGSASESSTGGRGGGGGGSGRGQSRERRFSTSLFSRSSRHGTSNPGASSTTANTAPPSSSTAAQTGLDIRYLGIQFSRNPSVQTGSDGELVHSAPFSRGEVILGGSSKLARESALFGQQADESVKPHAPKQDHSRFLLRWDAAHAADAQFEATFPTNHVELPSPYVNGDRPPHTNGVSELQAQVNSPELTGSFPPAAPGATGGTGGYYADSDGTQ